jgi:hypothetical protein
VGSISSISNISLDIKREEGRKVKGHNSNPDNNNNNHNQCWFRPRDKNGRFMCSTCATTTATTTTTPTSHNKLRDERGRFISASPLAT